VADKYVPKPPKPVRNIRTALEQKIWEEIDRKFDDPFGGRFPRDFVYFESPYAAWDQDAKEVYYSEYYRNAGYKPIWWYAVHGYNNPMTKEDWENTMGENWYGDLSTSSNVATDAILREIHTLDRYNASNREPNYLSYLIKYHPKEIERAKNQFYNDALVVMDLESFWEYLNVSLDDVIGDS